MPVDPKSYPKTTRAVNAFLKKKGVKEELVKGQGYFYFVEGDTDNWKQSSVYVYRISDLSLERWYGEWQMLSKNTFDKIAPGTFKRVFRKDESMTDVSDKSENNIDEALSPGTLKDAPARPHWADSEDEDGERDPPWHFDHKWIEGLHFIDDEWIAYGVKGTVLNPNIANEIAGVLNSQHGTHLAADDISINRVRKIRGNNEYYFIIVKNHWPTVNKFKRKLKSVTSNRDESKMENDTAAPVLGKWQEGIFKPPGGGYAIGLKSPTFSLNKGNVAKLVVIQAKEKLGMDIEPKQISFGALMRDKSDKDKIIATFMINSKDAAAIDTAALELTADDGEKLQNGIKAPVVNVKLSTLGGAGRQALMITVSLDAKSDWKNGILQNSRYAQIRLDNDGSLEHFSGRIAPKYNMRKTKVKSVDDAIAKINKFLAGAPAVDNASTKVSYSDYMGTEGTGSVSSIRAYLEDGGIIWANPSTKKKGGFAIFVSGGPSGPLATVNNVADLRSWMKTYRVKPTNVENGGDLWKAMSKVPGWNKDAAHTDEAGGGTWAIFGRTKGKNHYGLLAARIDKEAAIQTGASKKGTGHYDDVKVMKVTAADMEALRSGQGKKVLIKYGLYKDTATQENDMTKETDTAAKPAAGAVKPYFLTYVYNDDKVWEEDGGFKTEKEAKSERDFLKDSDGKRVRIVKVPYKMTWTNEIRDKVDAKVKNHKGNTIIDCMSDCASAESVNEDTAKALGPKQFYYVTEEASGKLVLKTKEHAKVRLKLKDMFAKGVRFKVRLGSDENEPAAVKARIKAGAKKKSVRKVAKTKPRTAKKDTATVIDQAAFDNLDVAARLDFPSVIAELLMIFSKTQPGTEKTIPWKSVKTNAAKSVLQSFAARIQQSVPEFSLDIGENWAVTIKRPDGMTMNKFAAAMRPPRKSA